MPFDASASLLIPFENCRPIAFKKNSNNVYDKELSDNPYPTWQKLEEMVEKGKLKNIGVSKYGCSRRMLFVSNIETAVVSIFEGTLRFQLVYPTVLIFWFGKIEQPDRQPAQNPTSR